MKIIINSYPGGFSFSNLALYTYAKARNFICEFSDGIGPITEQEFLQLEVEDYSKTIWIKQENRWMSLDCLEGEFRVDPTMISIVETLEDSANGEYAELKIVEIPDDVEYYVHQNEDGSECIYEKHRTWS